MSGGASVWTTLAGAGVLSLNGLSDASQTFAVGTAGTTFNISSVGGVHTFNIPYASNTATGLLTSSDWTVFNDKLNLTSLLTGFVTAS